MVRGEWLSRDRWGDGVPGEGAGWKQWNSALLDTESLCWALWSNTEVLIQWPKILQPRLLQNQVVPLLGCFPYLVKVTFTRAASSGCLIMLKVVDMLK